MKPKVLVFATAIFLILSSFVPITKTNKHSGEKVKCTFVNNSGVTVEIYAVDGYDCLCPNCTHVVGNFKLGSKEEKEIEIENKVCYKFCKLGSTQWTEYVEKEVTFNDDIKIEIDASDLP